MVSEVGSSLSAVGTYVADSTIYSQRVQQTTRVLTCNTVEAAAAVMTPALVAFAFLACMYQQRMGQLWVMATLICASNLPESMKVSAVAFAATGGSYVAQAGLNRIDDISTRDTRDEGEYMRNEGEYENVADQNGNYEGGPNIEVD